MINETCNCSILRNKHWHPPSQHRFVFFVCLFNFFIKLPIVSISIFCQFSHFLFRLLKAQAANLSKIFFTKITSSCFCCFQFHKISNQYFKSILAPDGVLYFEMLVSLHRWNKIHFSTWDRDINTQFFPKCSGLTSSLCSFG